MELGHLWKQMNDKIKTTTSHRCLVHNKTALGNNSFTWPKKFTRMVSLTSSVKKWRRISELLTSERKAQIENSDPQLSFLGFPKSLTASNGDGCTETRREACFGPSDLSPPNQRRAILSYPCRVRLLLRFSLSNLLIVYVICLAYSSFPLFGCWESRGGEKKKP